MVLYFGVGGVLVSPNVAKAGQRSKRAGEKRKREEKRKKKVDRRK